MAEIGNVTFKVDAVITDEQYREAMGAVRAANERMDLLEAENAKLRELVRDMWHEGAFVPGACYVETDRLEERTRELGIEVE